MHKTQCLFFNEENGSDWLRDKGENHAESAGLAEKMLLSENSAIPVNVV
jgi:hypothetical protein